LVQKFSQSSVATATLDLCSDGTVHLCGEGFIGSMLKLIDEVGIKTQGDFALRWHTFIIPESYPGRIEPVSSYPFRRPEALPRSCRRQIRKDWLQSR